MLKVWSSGLRQKGSPWSLLARLAELEIWSSARDKYAVLLLGLIYTFLHTRTHTNTYTCIYTCKQTINLKSLDTKKDICGYNQVKVKKQEIRDFSRSHESLNITS